jgi:hypothetical protein
MSIYKGPLFSHFGDAIQGLVSVRAYGAEVRWIYHLPPSNELADADEQLLFRRKFEPKLSAESTVTCERASSSTT